jgi:16S rRNA (guanine966-N2)-methyltransferase
MRIVAGRHRGRKLISPEGEAIRPTADRARQALFNILGSPRYATDDGPLPRGASVLDAFAGVGALGLEALSRGAARAVFLDHEAAACRLIERNLAALGEPGLVLRRDATRPGPAPFPCALAFLDPPYGSGLAEPALVALAEAGWLAPGALVSVELGRRDALAPPAGFEALDERAYGAARLILLRRLTGAP